MPTPVTNRAMVIDRGSTRKATSTWNEPELIHVNRVWVKTRSSPSSPTRPKNTITAVRKAAPIMAVASHPARGSPRRLPATSRTRNPVRGRAGISQTASSTGAAPIP